MGGKQANNNNLKRTYQISFSLLPFASSNTEAGLDLPATLLVGARDPEVRRTRGRYYKERYERS